MSKKLAAKASLIQLPALRSTEAVTPLPAGTVTEGAPPSSPSPTPLGSATESRPKTAPGSMAVFMASQSSAIREAEELKIKLQAFDGAVPMRALDPKRIKASKWANRHSDAFADAEFRELRADIAAAGRNIQPICVRALSDDAAYDFELVFGHRRHHACLDLGLLVQAVVAQIDDKGLFEAMERENRGRKNLSAWEQGMMYRRALDNGLYPSQRKLAEAINVDLSLISKSLALARLPDAVVAAFSSPLDVQFRWAQPLGEALQKDPDGVVMRAKEIASNRGTLSGKEIFERLIKANTTVLNRSTPGSEVRVGKLGQGAVLSSDVSGRALLRFDSGVLTQERQHALLEWLSLQLGEAFDAKH